MTKKIIAGAIILTIILVVGAMFLQKNKLTPGENNFLPSLNSTTNNAAPDSALPFAELTIPYLRTKEIKSELQELNRISENSDYKTHLMSYDSDGLQINGLLTVPTGTAPAGGWPAIVFIHGYIPPTQYRTQEKYTDYVNFLARNKFVVFKIDLRGHGQSEGEASGAYYSADYVIDTLNAYAALQSAAFVNPEQIGLWGHSMAGNIILRTMAAKPEIPAAVIWAGAVYSYTDFLEYGIADQSYQRPSDNSPRTQKRRQLFETHGEFDPAHQFWRQVVATNYLNDFQGKIQLHHAINDRVVDVRYSRNLKKLLDQGGVKNELYEYPSGGHNLDGGTFGTAMKRTVEFFERAWE